MDRSGGLRNGWQIECRVQREAGSVGARDTVQRQGGLGGGRKGEEKQAQETNAAGRASRATTKSMLETEGEERDW